MLFLSRVFRSDQQKPPFQPNVKFLFLSHLHLPAAQPFVSLSPADVVWISSLVSHSGDRPPTQPASLSLRVHTYAETGAHTLVYKKGEKKGKKVTDVFLYLLVFDSWQVFLFVCFRVSVSGLAVRLVSSPLWASRSFCPLARLRGKEVTQSCHFDLTIPFPSPLSSFPCIARTGITGKIDWEKGILIFYCYIYFFFTTNLAMH